MKSDIAVEKISPSSDKHSRKDIPSAAGILHFLIISVRHRHFCLQPFLLFWCKLHQNSKIRTKKLLNQEFLYGISSFCTLSENSSFLHGKISCFCIFLAEHGAFNTNRSPRVADGICNEPRSLSLEGSRIFKGFRTKKFLS